MSRIILIFLFLNASTIVSAQDFQSFINYANGITDQTQRQNTVDSFMNVIHHIGIPYLENDTIANFIYKGNASSVHIAGDFSFWSPDGHALSNLQGTDFWYSTQKYEANARLDYKVIVNGNWILDPLNPNQILGGFGPNSELAMPNYIQPWEIHDLDNVGHGRLETFSINSTIMNASYTIHVYLPPQYDDNLLYPTVYVQDGGEYIGLANADHIIDNLLDSALVSPMIGVFVVPNERNSEYAGSARNNYTRFFVEELVPYIDEQYNTIPEAKARAVLGDSFGGNISALISFKHPDIFGNCGLHSGAFQQNNFEANDLVLGEKKDIKVASVWGTYEGSLTQNMRTVRNSLAAKGYDLYSKELPEGHSWGLWRATIDDLLKFFFPHDITQVKTNTKLPLSIDLTYFPNPITNELFIKVPLGKYQIQVYNINGQLVLNKTDQPVHTEQYRIALADLEKGIYFLKVKGEKIIYTGRFLK